MTEKTTPSRLRSFLGAGLCAVAFLALAFLYFNWGIWRSKSYELLGVELPLETVYRTDLSGRGREAGYFVVVYRLPADTQKQLDAHAIDLAQYPMFCAGFERDDYKRVNWAHGFPRNDIEEHIFNFFKKGTPATEPPPIEHIASDNDAELLANYLLHVPQTVCGGWYKDGTRESSGHIWMPHFHFYVMNIERRTLIMFGRDT
jgi:hypothetical protein